MPELPEVETIASGLKHAILGKQFSKIERFIDVIRYPVTVDQAPKLINTTIVDVRRRARYILIEFENLYCITIHLGMSGSLLMAAKEDERKKHDHILCHLPSGETLRFNCPRRFGFIKHEKLSQANGTPRDLAKLGVEPLTSEFNGEYFKQQIKNSRASIKNLLMKNEIVVGVGNIYVSETLFLAKINPKRLGNSLTLSECNTLINCVKKTLKKAIKEGGTTLSDYHKIDGSEGKFAQHLNVYGRPGRPCPICKNPIEKIIIGGRSTFFCPKCQPI